MSAPRIELTSAVVKDLTALGFHQDNVRYCEREDEHGNILSTKTEVIYTTNIIAN